MRPASLLPVAVAAATLAACGGGDGGPTDPAPRVASVEVTPSSDTSTALGATRDFEATAPAPQRRRPPAAGP